MKLNIPISTLLIVAIITYVIGFTGDPFLFVILFPIGLLASFFLILLPVANLIWMLLPSKIKETHGRHKTRFSVTILTCLIILFLGGWAINHYYLPGKFSFISILADLGILLFTIMLGCSFLKPTQIRLLLTGTIAIVLLIFIFAVTHIGYHPTPMTYSSEIEKLKSLPYLSYVVKDKDVEKKGVVIYKKDSCHNAFNIYNSNNLPGAYLLDMPGNVLHTWLPEKSHPHWHYTEIYNNNDLLVIIKDVMLMRLDWNSNIRWAKQMRFHHDVAIADNEDIYVLARKDEIVFNSGLPLPILNDYIVILSSDGMIKKEISLYEILKKEISPDKFSNIYRWMILPENLREMITRKRHGLFIFKHGTPFDVLHTNTIELINKEINGIFKKGNILFCSAELNLIGVIDVKEQRLLWSWGTNYLERPHHPTLLESGNMLIFDNGYPWGRKYSRVIELEPCTKKIVWKYECSPRTSFYTDWGGANQRLPNGNTLITESSKGRVFEITKEGETVWEFYNPNKYKNGKRSTIYRMMRITDPEKCLFFKKLLRFENNCQNSKKT